MSIIAYLILGRQVLMEALAIGIISFMIIQFFAITRNYQAVSSKTVTLNVCREMAH